MINTINNNNNLKKGKSDEHLPGLDWPVSGEEKATFLCLHLTEVSRAA